MYSENDLVAIAKRENNKKRNYLVVNPLQGKHIPVSPTESLSLFEQLAEIVKKAYGREKILIIGFAETATAIGAQVAITVGGEYIQTTRECIDDVDYFFFSEAHSHATEQKLVKNDLDQCINKVDRIIFVEDEVTTGNTIMNIIRILKDAYGNKVYYSVASLLNGMDTNNLNKYAEHNINLHYIIKTSHTRYSDAAERYANNGSYYEPNLTEMIYDSIYCKEGYINTRRVCEANDYEKACESLWRKISDKIKPDSNLKYLVLGTEEFMYPALFVGKKYEETGCYVRSHSTTRSPIMVSTDENYPLNERYELRSVYDKKRVTFLYDIDSYDEVIIITDARDGDRGVLSLANAVGRKNSNITVVRWC